MEEMDTATIKGSPASLTESSDSDLSGRNNGGSDSEHSQNAPTIKEPLQAQEEEDQNNKTTKLVVTFILFVIVGSAFQVFAKLQTVPMYNYPNFLNIFGCILFVPLCFLYIIPAAKMGVIPEDQLNASKKPFLVMALFDTVSSTMLVFASVYLPGPLLVLLPQAAIPISMAFSKLYLRSKYGRWHYVGAAVVILGILVVLEPVMTNRHAPMNVCVAVDKERDRDCSLCHAEVTQDGCLSRATLGPDANELAEAPPFVGQGVRVASSDQTCRWVESTHETSGTSTTLFWSGVLLLSCVPVTLSSIYKEHTLGEMQFDPVYLNGWLTLFQTPLSVLVAIPAGLVASPPVLPQDFPSNMVDGFRCALGRGTIVTGCHPDTCAHAMPLICVFIIICFLYTNLMVLLLKFGSANIMFLATTMIIPLSNLAFAMKFMPNPAVLHASDLFGLCVIMAGIVSYRFGSTLCGETSGDNGGSDNLNEPLLPEMLQATEHSSVAPPNDSV